MDMNLMRDVVLTAAGNAAIAHVPKRPPWPDYVGFAFQRDCVFSDKDKVVLASDPNAWIESLRSRCSGLWLHCVPRAGDDRLNSAFLGGGPRWIIEAVQQGGSELWEGEDRIEKPDAPDRRIYRVTYTRIATGWTRPRPNLRISGVKAAIDSAVAAVETFARDEAAHFVPFFSRARAELHDAEVAPSADHLEEFAELGLEARQLWAAITSAYQFGGMGSWNDRSYEGEKGGQYDAISQALFDALNAGIEAVANSTFPT